MTYHCPICTSSRTKLLLKWIKPFKIYYCNNCYLLFAVPLPLKQDLIEYYQNFLFKLPAPEDVFDKVLLAQDEILNLFNINEKKIINKKFLDFGGGTGIMSQAAKSIGLDSYFYDIDKSSTEYVKENFSVNVLHRHDELFNLKYDYILADNVIEHSKHPIETVKNLYEMLTDNGLLILKTPNARSTELIFFPKLIIKKYLLKSLKFNSIINSIYALIFRYWTCDPPRHLYSFSEKSLNILMHRCSINNFRISTYYSQNKFLYSPFKNNFSHNCLSLKSIILLLNSSAENLLSIVHNNFKRKKIISPAGLILKIYKNSV